MEKEGTVTSFDSATGMGRYVENGTSGPELRFEVPNPTVVVIPGDLVTVLVATPSGRTVEVVKKVKGNPV